MCNPQGAVSSRRVRAGRVGCLWHLVAEGALAARTVCPASCRGSGRLVSLGSVEKGRKMMSSSGRVRVQGRKAESSTKKKGGGKGAIWGRAGRNGRWFAGEEERRLGRKWEGERAKEEEEKMRRVGGGWPEARRGPRRRAGAWQIGGACGDGDQMAAWVLPEQLCLHPQPCPAEESVLVLLTEGEGMHKATAWWKWRAWNF